MTTSVAPSKVLTELRKLYPDAKSELDFQNSFQLLIAVMLSAQCTDKKVNQVTPDLFKKYSDFKKLSRANLSDIEGIIRPINYYKTKSRNLIATAQAVLDQHAGTLPLSHSELIELPGVGRKTANVVLSELNIEPAIAVDTHVFRLSHRLGFSTGKTTLKVEEDLQKQFPSKDWRMLHHGLILHGRRICKAQSPLCNECVLSKFCPSFGKFSKT